ncbi:hypothetical protein TNCV_1614741 [Trichonephila clavipes]|nr:hypothetical protein TNCV_1614741 [Trichonephila clavipes]
MTSGHTLVLDQESIGLTWMDVMNKICVFDILKMKCPAKKKWIIFLMGYCLARQHRHWTVDDWKYVVWSGKSRFQFNRADRRVRVCRQPNESIDDKR